MTTSSRINKNAMLCQNCQKNEAAVKVTRTVNGEKKTLHFCKKCAGELNLDNSVSMLSDFLGKIMDEVFTGDKKATKTKAKICPKCRLTFADFRKTGLLGCSGCYEAFSDEIRKMVFKIHGSNHHTGIVPGVKKKPNLSRLRKDLESAIKNEEYEQAAHIRDLIQGIENEN